jgi:hypothetical protein
LVWFRLYRKGLRGPSRGTHAKQKITTRLFGKDVQIILSPFFSANFEIIEVKVLTDKQSEKISIPNTCVGGIFPVEIWYLHTCFAIRGLIKTLIK